MKFDSTGFEPLANAFSTCIQAYNTSREKIVQAQKTVKENWEGETKDAFEEIYEQMFMALADCGDILAAMNNELQAALATYISADQSAAREITRTGSPK